MSNQRPPERRIVRPAKQSFKEIITNSLDQLATASSQRMLDRDERALFELILKAGLSTSDVSLEDEKPTQRKKSVNDLLKLVEDE